MSTYASKTSVPVERSRIEIERILKRYGADQFVYGSKARMAMIGFHKARRSIRFVLPLPDITDYGRQDSRQRQQRWEQACRSAWRALALAIKAKLEAVETGIATFEDEFLAYTLLPGGVTVGEWAKPQIEETITTGRMPQAFPTLMLKDRAE